MKRKGSVERTGPSFCWGLSSCGFSFCTWPPAQHQLPPPFTSLLHPAPDTHAQAYAPTLSYSPYSRSSRTSLLDKVWLPPASIALTEFPVFGQHAWLNERSKALVTTRMGTVDTLYFVSQRILKLQNIVAIYIFPSVLGFHIR